MSTIEVDNRRAEDCLHFAMTKWLKLNYNTEKNGLPSWRMLAKAVYSIDRSVFNKIARDHPVNGIAMWLGFFFWFFLEGGEYISYLYKGLTCLLQGRGELNFWGGFFPTSPR